jgi:thymidylate synthase (FAD)
MDNLFQVQVLNQTLNPQTLIYAGMHQDYSEGFVWEERHQFPSETKCGEIAVKRLLAGDRGHFGCTETPSISFAVGYFPHSVMQQARTHRVGISFDVQSMRFTSKRIIEVAEGIKPVEEVFYLRPARTYTDRSGKNYTYTENQRIEDISECEKAALRYAKHIEEGMSEEHARGGLPFDYRQHFVVTFNMRSLMHFLDLRAKKDAQLEIQQLCELMMPHFLEWSPAIARWYQFTRLGKGRLAP